MLSVVRNTNRFQLVDPKHNCKLNSYIMYTTTNVFIHHFCHLYLRNCKALLFVYDKTISPQNFGAFWCLQVSCVFFATTFKDLSIKSDGKVIAKISANGFSSMRAAQSKYQSIDNYFLLFYLVPKCVS